MKRPFGRGPTTRSLGDNNEHHGYQPLTSWDDSPSRATRGTTVSPDVSLATKTTPLMYQVYKLAWPMANRLLTFWGDEYLVGKISRSNFYFRVHWLSEQNGMILQSKKSDPQDPRFTDPEKTWVSKNARSRNLRATGSVGIRSHSMFDGSKSPKVRPN